MTETYPRVYRYGPGWTTAIIFVSLVFLAGGAAFAIWRHQIFEYAPVSALVIAAVFEALAILSLWSLKCRTILYEDRVEYVGLFGRRVAYKVEIKRSSNIHRSYTMLELTLELTNGRKMKVGDFNRRDDAFTQWFAAFPNAEVQAENMRVKALLANPAFASNPTEREYHINLDVRRINFIGWPCYGIVLWGMVWPRPYDICLPILLTMPVLGLLATFASRGRWTMLDDEKHGRLNIGARLFAGPALVVALRAFQDDNVADWVAPAIWSVAAGVALMALNGLIERRLTWGLAIGFVFMWGIYALGGLSYADIELDPSPGRPVPVRVLQRHGGEHGDSLTVTAWGPRETGNEVNVAGSLFRGVHKGDTVCVYVYPGRLNWPWYAVGHCPRGK